MKTLIQLTLLSALLITLTSCNTLSFNRKDEASEGENAIDALQPQQSQAAKQALIEMAKLEALKNKLNQDIVELKAKKATLAENLETVQQQLKKTETARENETAKAKSIEQSNDKLLTENKILLQHFEDLKKKVSLLELQRKKEQIEAKQLSGKISTSRQELNALVAKQKSASTQLNELSQQRNKLETEIKTFSQIKKSLSQNIGQLTKTIQAFESWQKKQVPTTDTIAPKQESTPQPPVSRKEEQPSLGQQLALKSLKCPVSKDTYIISSDQTVNKGAAKGVAVGYSATHGSLVSLFRFDLSSIPPGRKITKAVFHYYANQHIGNQSKLDLLFYPIDKSWNEKAANWTNVSFTNKPAAIAFVDRAPQWYSADMTSLVKQWLDGKTENNGFLIKTPSATDKKASNYFIFGSKEVEKAAPYLEVTYQQP